MAKSPNLSILAAEREQLLADKAALHHALVVAREFIIRRTLVRRNESPLKEINEALDGIRLD